MWRRKSEGFFPPMGELRSKRRGESLGEGLCRYQTGCPVLQQSKVPGNRCAPVRAKDWHDRASTCARWIPSNRNETVGGAGPGGTGFWGKTTKVSAGCV